MITKKTPLKKILSLAPSCHCNDCSHGCTMGSGFLAEGDIKKLASFLKISEKELKTTYLEEVNLFNKTLHRPKLLREGKPYGKCVFYDKGCSVHEAKPLQCKISMGCKEYGEDLNIWFMLNHIVNTEDPESIRHYAQYLRSDGKTIPGGQLSDIVPTKRNFIRYLDTTFLDNLFSKFKEQCNIHRKCSHH